jgi:two-component system, cell cycle response regulator
MLGVAGLGLVIADQYTDVGEVAIWLAVAALGAVVARLLLGFRENRRLINAIHREQSTDSLTGLPNRRSLVRMLAGAAQGPGEVIFAILDLDGFKAYNDSFGHSAGDVLLRRLGQNLATAVAPGGMAFRLGGDEFCIIAPGGEERVDEVVATARAGLSESGEGFEITASLGAVVLPTEAHDATAALRVADTRMHTAKARRPASPHRQTHDVLIRILRERDPWLGDHLRGVAQLAAAIGKAAKLEADQLDALVRAAELHDIGKIAIPDRILHKPGPLDGAEWELMRRHPAIGERVLAEAPAMAPVAALVRSSHERWDGGGYPDGLEGEEIPRGSRIIFVCDAFEAMIETRSYREARSPDEALAELRRCAGTQFDAEVVELFAEQVFPRLDADPVIDPASPLATNEV